MTYTAVGSSFGVNGSGITTFSLTTSTVGDFILAEVSNHGTALPTSLSSSNVTWSTLGSGFATVTNAGRNLQCFIGVVTSASTQTVTIGLGAGTQGVTVCVGQEFSSTTGTPVLDVQGNLDQASGSTWVSLTPAVNGELYFGWAANSGAASSGTTSGYTYIPNSDTQSDGMAYNVNCAASVATAPTWADTGEQFGIMVLVRPAATPPLLPPGRAIFGKRARKGSSQGSPAPAVHLERVPPVPSGTTIRGRKARKGTSAGSGLPAKSAPPVIKSLAATGASIRGRIARKGSSQGSPAPLLHLERVPPVPSGTSVRGSKARKGASLGSGAPAVSLPPAVKPPATTGASVRGRKARKGSAQGSPLPLLHIENVPAVPSGASVRGRQARKGSSLGSSAPQVSPSLSSRLPTAGTSVRGRPARKGASLGSSAPRVSPAPSIRLLLPLGAAIRGRRARKGTSQGSPLTLPAFVSPRAPLVEALLGGTVVVPQYAGTVTQIPYGGVVTQVPYGGTVTQILYGGTVKSGGPVVPVQQDITGNVVNDDVYANFAITYNGAPLNLTPYVVKVVLKNSRNVPDSTGVTFTTGSGITITNSAQGQFTLDVPHADLSTPLLMWYRCYLVDGSNENFTALYGNFQVLAA